MMYALAQFIMKGRLQAAVLALLGIPLLSSGAIGLVTLRLGAKEGALMVLIGLAPAIVSGVMGRPAGLLLWVGLMTLLAVYGPALLLRATSSWLFTLLGSIAAISLLSVILVWQIEGFAEIFGAITALSLSMLSNVPIDPEVNELPMPSNIAIAGLVAFITLLNGVTGLILSRWWQSLLYNPKGFGEEFQSLRVAPLPAVVLAVSALLCYSLSVDYSFWFAVFVIPFALVSIAVVHNVISYKGLGKSWLVSFYLLIVFLFSPMIVILAIIGFIDTWLNFRKRFAA